MIRNVLGIRKRTEFAPEELERRRTSMTRLFAVQGLANAIAPIPLVTEENAPILEPELTNHRVKLYNREIF